MAPMASSDEIRKAYSEKPDEDLLALAGKLDGLAEPAIVALRIELEKRNLRHGLLELDRRSKKKRTIMARSSERYGLLAIQIWSWFLVAFYIWLAFELRDSAWAVFAVFGVVISVGLLKLYNWARILCAVFAFLTLFAYFFGGILFPFVVWVMYYLTRPEVDEAFGIPRKKPKDQQADESREFVATSVAISNETQKTRDGLRAIQVWMWFWVGVFIFYPLKFGQEDRFFMAILFGQLTVIGVMVCLGLLKRRNWARLPIVLVGLFPSLGRVNTK